MKYKAVIFDLDGVICSTDQYHYQAWKRMADEINVHFDEKINNRLRGVSRMESLEIILQNSEKIYSSREKERLAGQKNEYYKELLQNMTPSDLSGEVKDTLDALRDMGLNLAIGSSSKNTKFILKQIGLDGYFDEISDGTNIVNSKPDPEVFLKAAQFLGLTPEECMVVEDAKAGIEAAARGGFESAGLGEAAKSSLVTFPIEKFADLLSVV